LKAAFDESRDLVHPGLRQHEIRMLAVKREQPLLIFRETEEIALFFDPFDRGACWPSPLAARTDGDLALPVVRFVADRVPTGIFGEIDVAVLGHALPDRLRSAIVPRL